MDRGIRRAAPDDVPRLVDLMAEFYAESSYPLDRASAASTFGRLLGEESLGAAWLLSARGEVAGYVVLTVGYSMEYGGLDAFVDDLFIRAPHRGAGLGRLALETLVAECRRRGVRAVHLEVARENAPAQGLYARFGFQDNDRQLLTRRLEGPG